MYQALPCSCAAIARKTEEKKPWSVPGPRAGGHVYQSVVLTTALPIFWSDGRKTNITDNITDIESANRLDDLLLVLFKI